MLFVGNLAHLAAATTAILGRYMVLHVVFPSQPLWDKVCQHLNYPPPGTARPSGFCFPAEEEWGMAEAGPLVGGTVCEGKSESE